MKGIRIFLALAVNVALATGLPAQEASSADAEVDTASTAAEAPPVIGEASVLRLIRFNGAARGAQGQALAGTVGVTFALYEDQEGGAPLWLETQNVQLDQQGRYTALLGSTSNEGLPLDIFSSGEARWLGIQVQGQPEQPRVLLVSVPYAMKAAEAETLSGKSASDFVLSEQLSTQVEEEINTQIEEQGLVTTEESETLAQVDGSGTTGQIAKFTSATTVGDSIITEANGRIGIGFDTPVQKLVIGAAGGRMLNVSNLANQDLEIRLSTRLAADKFALIAPTTPTNLALGVGGDEKMRITNAGDVGIGTSSPTAKLDVAGSANITGNLQVNDTGGLAILGSTDNAGANASGVRGFATAATGTTIGVWGRADSSSDTAAGVLGEASAGTGETFGVHGESLSASGVGVFGESPNIGVEGESSGANGQGVRGVASDATGVGGVFRNVADGKILSGENSTREVFSVDGIGTATVFTGSSLVIGFKQVGGDTPALRLEQDTTGGFSAYSWDVAGNEANFFIRDVQANTLPLQIRPGAAEGTLEIESNSNVGIGAGTALDKLHVAGEVRVTDCVKNSSGTGIAGTCASDIRFKKDIEPFGAALEQVAQLKPVHFFWRADEFPERGFGGGRSYGLIAQEAEAALPELVTESEDGYKKVNYSLLPLLLLQAIRELKSERDNQEEQTALLAEVVEQQQTQLRNLQAELRAVKARLHAGDAVQVAAREQE